MKKASKSIALFLTFAVLQLAVHANPATIASVHLAKETTRLAAEVPQGRLATRGNAAIILDGASALSGETVFSGQQIQTPAATGATVQLGQLGRVDLAPNSNATLAFENDRVVATLASGCVVLTANRGVTGTVAAQGMFERSDAASGGTIDLCVNSTPGAAPMVGKGMAAAAFNAMPYQGGSGGGGGLNSGTAFVLAAAIVTAFALIAHEVISDSDEPDAALCTPGPNNPSSNLPTGCQ